MTAAEIANKWQMNRFRTAGQEGGLDNGEFYLLLQHDIEAFGQQQTSSLETRLKEVEREAADYREALINIKDYCIDLERCEDAARRVLDRHPQPSKPQQ